MNPNRPELTIFFLNLEVGGAERIMLQLAHGFLAAGHSVDLVLAHAHGPLVSEAPAGARIIDLNVNNYLTMLASLIGYLRSEKPSALLSPFEATSVIAILAKKLSAVSTRVVACISVHLSLHKRPKWRKFVERIVISMLYPFADGIVTVSRGVAEDLSGYTGTSLERVKVIYNPVVSEQLLQAAEQPVHHPFFSDDQYSVILGVGRLAEQKDFSTLIRAFDIVRRRIPSRLIILGDGAERPALQKLICSSGLQDMVDLPGFQLNPFAFMKRASVFVLSSKWEGLPGVLIEALACGCPVVSTDCLSGPSEILKEGQYGHLVPVGNVEAMASAIEDVLKGNILKPPVSWLEQYTNDSVVRQYKAVLGI